MSEAAAIVELLPLVEKTAAWFHMKWPTIPKEDLASEGVIGLLDAVRRFDGRKASLHTFASHRVRGAIMDAIRRLLKLRRNGKGYRRVTEVPIPLTRNGEPFDVADERATLLHDDFEALLALVEHAKQRRVLELRYTADLTFREIADVMEVSEVRVCQLHRKGIARLRQRIGAA